MRPVRFAASKNLPGRSETPTVGRAALERARRGLGKASEPKTRDPDEVPSVECGELPSQGDRRRCDLKIGCIDRQAGGCEIRPYPSVDSADLQRERDRREHREDALNE